MATITGRLVNIVLGPPLDYPVGLPVYVRLSNSVIAVGRLDEGNEFSIEVDDVAAELEISIGLSDVSTVRLDFDGRDAHIEFMHNGSRRYS